MYRCIWKVLSVSSFVNHPHKYPLEQLAIIKHKKLEEAEKALKEKIKKSKADGTSDDEIKLGEADVQKLTDNSIIQIDKLAETKEKDIMTV